MKSAGTLGLVIALLACIGAFVTSSVQIVEANHVGIPVFMGSIGDELKPGLHFVNPFSDIHTFDTRNVISSRLARLNEGDKAESDCVVVLDGSRAKTCVDVSLVLSLKNGNVDLPALYVGLLSPMLPIAARPGECLATSAERVDQARRLEREIAALETRLRNEPQFNRKVELRRQLRRRSDDLNDLITPKPLKTEDVP